MRGAGSEQAHADDMFFLDGALAHAGQHGVAGAQIAHDAGDEHHQQRRVQREADQHALDVEAEVAALVEQRQLDGLGPHGQPRQAGAGDADNGPGGPRFQQHRAEDDLQQVEVDKGIGGAAAQVELRREAGHVHQHGDEELGVGHGPLFMPAQLAGHVEGDQAGQHFQHVDQRQLDAEAPGHHGDGGDLADHSDPAQLDQLLHVLVPRRLSGFGRRQEGRQFCY